MSNTPLTPGQIVFNEQQAAHEAYLHRLAVGFDQFMNVATDGLPDETISSRAQRLSSQGNEFAMLLTRALDELQPSHGRTAEAGDLERAQAVVATEEQALGTTVVTTTVTTPGKP
jgi:hypothetical protein